MDLKPIISQIAVFAAKAYEKSKIAVYWCGHTIKAGYSQYAIPFGEKISAIALIIFNLVKKLMITGPGFIFALAGSLLLAGITAFKLADRKIYEDDSLAKTAWKTMGIIAFVSATAVTSLGIGALLI